MAPTEAKPSMDETLPVAEKPQLGEKRNPGASAGIHPSLYILCVVLLSSAEAIY